MLCAVAVAIAARQTPPPAPPVPAPAQPHQLRPAEKARLQTRHVMFDWNPVPSATTYRLQVGEVPRGGASPFTGVLAADLSVNTPQQVVAAGLDWGRDYAWRVRPLGGSDPTQPTPIGPWLPIHRFSLAQLPPHCPPTAATKHLPQRCCPGLTLFNVSSVNRVFGGQDAGIALVVDADGQIVWFRYSPKRFTDLRLLPNGNMLYVTDEVAWEAALDGRVVWRTPPGHRVHHDATPLPNGNLLCLVYDERRVTIGGRRETWVGDAVEEISRSGGLVWRWSLWEHLSTSDRDEISYRQWKREEPYDWTHCNAAHYNDRHKAVYLSVRNLSRILKIDRRSKSIVWKLGLGGQAGQDLFTFQHAPQLLSNNHLMIYDNGNRRGGKDAGQDLAHAYSRAIEVAFTSVQPLQATIVWERRMPYGVAQGEADRLSNGNTLIADGYNGRIVEVALGGEMVWEVLAAGSKPQDYIIYRSERIPSLYPQYGNPPVIQ